MTMFFGQGVVMLPEGIWPRPIVKNGLAFLGLLWLLSFAMMRFESFKLRDQPWSAKERRL